MEVSQEARATVSDGNLPAQGTLDVDRLAQHARLLGRKEERRRYNRHSIVNCVRPIRLVLSNG
jgi:hypothetical protein